MTEWAMRNGAALVLIACAVVAIVEAVKRAAHHGAGSKMEGRGWQASLRWLLPLGAGGAMGAVPGLWTADVSLGMGVLLGVAAGGPLGRTIYAAVRERIPGLLTSTARTAPGGDT